MTSLITTKLEKKPKHLMPMMIFVENLHAQLCAPSFFLVFLLLGKLLDALGNCSPITALVIENRNWFFYSNSWDAGKIPVYVSP